MQVRRSFSVCTCTYTIINISTPGDQQQQQQQQQKQQQLQIGDLTVQLNQNLGYGSFGTVYKASYQGTPVAAKYLYHPVRNYKSFKHELETLQGFIHPNLVAYRAAAMGPVPRTSHPILVMELMEKSLTQFLEEAENDIPVHLQVNLCLDITFALVYLHSHQIVHGKLSSNNVLLVGTTAKVADFGMSKLLDSQSSVMQPASYLPPEARVTPSQKSDVFSFGVLVVQIVSREALTSLNPRQQIAPLSTVDRRQQHIQKIASAHPLRDIAILCLRESAMERPTVKKVVTKLSTVKYHPQYVASLKQEREKVQREIAQLKGKLKSKEEFAPKDNQEDQKQMEIAKREVAQLKEKLKSKEELALKEKQGSQKQMEIAKREVAQLKEKLKSKEELALKEKQGSRKQMEIAKREVAQLKEKLKSKEELALKDTQESGKQMRLARREIVQLQAELKSKVEFTQKQKQENEKQKEVLLQQVKERDQEIASIRLTFGLQRQTLLALKKEVEVKSIQVQDRNKQILKQSQESQKQMGLAQREIAQLKGKLKSKEELALKQKQESEKQMEKLQQQLREKDLRITTVQTAYGTQHQALLVMTSKLQNESEGAQALRKELEEKLQDRDKQIQACEMEVKKILQQSQKKDIKISELEAWKKNTKTKSHL